MADTISHAQQPGGSPEHVGWHGVQVNKVRRPLTNEEIEVIAARLRKQQGLDNPSASIGPQFGISRDHALFLARLEAKVLELETRVAALEAAQRTSIPRHLANVERRA